MKKGLNGILIQMANGHLNESINTKLPIFFIFFFYIGKIIDYNILNFLFNFIFECVYVHVL